MENPARWESRSFMVSPGPRSFLWLYPSVLGQVLSSNGSFAVVRRLSRSPAHRHPRYIQQDRGSPVPSWIPRQWHLWGWGNAFCWWMQAWVPGASGMELASLELRVGSIPPKPRD